MAPSKSKEIDGGDADLAKVRTLRTLGLVSELTENRVILGFPRIGQVCVVVSFFPLARHHVLSSVDDFLRVARLRD